MLCILVAKGTPCYRVMTLIPGFDDYIYLPPDRYDLLFSISWFQASGRGEIYLVIEAELKKPDVEVSVIGTRPVDATGWAVAKGSTRTYSMLVESVNPKVSTDGYARTRAWIWFFSPQGRGGREVTVVVSDEYGEGIVGEKGNASPRGPL